MQEEQHSYHRPRYERVRHKRCGQQGCCGKSRKYAWRVPNDSEGSERAAGARGKGLDESGLLTRDEFDQYVSTVVVVEGVVLGSGKVTEESNIEVAGVVNDGNAVGAGVHGEFLTVWVGWS